MGAVSGTLARRKALLVVNIPTPYRIPLWNELARQLRAERIDLKLVFAALGYGRRRWAVDLGSCVFEYEVLPHRSFSIDDESPSFTYRGLLGLIARDRPDVVLVGGFSLAALKVWWRSLVRPTCYLIWSGAIAVESGQSRWRVWQRRLVVSRASAFISYGSRARDLLVALGAPPARTRIAINTVDTEFFRQQTDRSQLPAGRNEFLCIGDLTPRKRPDLLLQAFGTLARSRAGVRLTFVGDGPLRADLGRQAEQLGVAGVVSFEGFRQRSELPPFLGRACCFLFPTDFDIWGLVLVEAMAAGVPCIASVRAGATCDVIEEGVTGLQADFHAPETVAAKMAFIIDNPERAARMGEAGRDFIRQKVNLATSAAGAAAAVRLALAPPR